MLIASLAVACHDATNPTGPTEPQFAKGGKASDPDPKLEEFWVYSTDGCDQMIHIVVSGTFLSIGKDIIHDHFFNGVRDLETHFEFGFGGPITPPTEFNADGTIGHADVCFDGIRSVDRDADGNRTFTSRFVDYPATSVDGTGADPFAISPGVILSQTKGSTSFRTFRPRGVVANRDTLSRNEPEVTSSWHQTDFQDVSSYAVYQGAPASGDLFYNGLSMGDASCSVATSQVGRGKNKTTVTTTTVSANVTVDYGADAEYNQHFWSEGHFRLVTDDTPDGVISRRIMMPQTDGTFSASADFDGDWSGQTVVVDFIADFLNATSGTEEWPGHYSEIYDFVYNPGQNSMSTTAGIGGLPWDVEDNVSKELDDGLFPVVYAGSVAVECN
ncbi:MAG: hypothetical protein P8X82_11445 [Gemmatimonadales bacterium]